MRVIAFLCARTRGGSARSCFIDVRDLRRRAFRTVLPHWLLADRLLADLRLPDRLFAGWLLAPMALARPFASPARRAGIILLAHTRLVG